MATLKAFNTSLYFKSKTRAVILVLALLISVALAIGLLNSATIFRSRAQTSFDPLDVRVANLTKNSLLIAYRTETAVQTAVVYSGADGNDKIAVDTLGTKNLFTHLAEIQSLSPGKTYHFQIGKYEFNQTMPPPGTYTPGQAKVITGTLVDPSNKDFSDTIVVLQTRERFFATRPDDRGNWLITWANNYQPDGQLEIGYPLDPTQVIIYPANLAVYSHNFDWSSVATISTGFSQKEPVVSQSLSLWEQLKKIFFTFVPKF